MLPCDRSLGFLILNSERPNFTLFKSWCGDQVGRRGKAQNGTNLRQAKSIYKFYLLETYVIIYKEDKHIIFTLSMLFPMTELIKIS